MSEVVEKISHLIGLGDPFASYCHDFSLLEFSIGLLKAIHTRGGLLPASIHVFEAGWREYVNVRVAPPALREGHPTSAIPVEDTCIREGK